MSLKKKIGLTKYIAGFTIFHMGLQIGYINSVMHLSIMKDTVFTMKSIATNGRFNFDLDLFQCTLHCLAAQCA